MKLTLSPYAKAIAAAIGQVLVYGLYTYGNSNKWVEVGVALASALSVYAVPNAAKAPAPVALPPLPPAGPPA